MKEHPIPQDIVGYRFHIVGNMTIKQFAEVGVGVFLAFILYQTNLLDIIKWPLMALSVATGAALAFVPIEERPLDHWLFTFFKILYRPTKYYWKREAKIPELFDYKAQKPDKNQPFEVDLTPARRERIKEYMLSIRSQQADTFDQEREKSISDILTTFTEVSVSGHATANVAKPRLKVRVRSLGSAEREEAVAISQAEQETYAFFSDVAPAAAEAAALSDPALDPTYQQAYQPLTHNQLDVSQVAQDIQIPEQQAISVEEPTIQQDLTDSANQTLSDNASLEPSTDFSTFQPSNEQVVAGAATFNQDLPFPIKPTQPNKLVGMVLSPQNELINDAIVEIKDANGNTLRAVKTNALGQFFVTTPLANGSYILETEREGLSFSPITLTLNNTIIDPVEIRSLT